MTQVLIEHGALVALSALALASVIIANCGVIAALQ